MFILRNLSVLAYAQGFTLWHYRDPTNLLSIITAPGFFDVAFDMVAVGDMVMVSAFDGGSLRIVTKVSPQIVLSPLI